VVLPITYDVLQVSNSAWTIIGNWTYSHNKEQLSMAKGIKSIRPGNCLRIMTIIEPPFTYFERNNETDLSKLQGYGIELLRKLSSLEGFEYELKLPKDGQYGIFDEETNQWTGIIGEIAKGNVDMAIAPITVTPERARVVDYLPHYKRLQLVALVKRAYKSNYRYNEYSFLHPFTATFYIALLITVTCLSIILSALSAISPYGIRGKFVQSGQAAEARAVDEIRKKTDYFELSKHHRQVLKDRRDAQSGTGIHNLLFLVWSGLFYQSPVRTPQSVSAKIIVVTWFLAGTVFIASYTAEVVNSVSLHAQEIDIIRSVGDLILHPDVGYGAIENSLMLNQLRDSGSSAGRQMYRTIVSGESPLHYVVPNVARGVDLAKHGNYAHIDDSVFMRWFAAESKCELKTIPLGFGRMDYALPVRKWLPMYDSLSKHIHDLNTNGFLEQLWEKYFLHSFNCLHLDEANNRSRSLTFVDLAGVFYLVAFGILAGCATIVIEWLVAALFDTTSLNFNHPKTLKEALKIRWCRFLVYVQLHWFPFRRMINKWKKAQPVPSDIAVGNEMSCFMGNKENLHPRAGTHMSLLHDSSVQCNAPKYRVTRNVNSGLSLTAKPKLLKEKAHHVLVL